MNMYRCKFCNKQFDSKGKLGAHVLWQHGSSDAQLRAKEALKKGTKKMHDVKEKAKRSELLKKRWMDPVQRKRFEYGIQKAAEIAKTLKYRLKHSRRMKEMWKDQSYRSKVLEHLKPHRGDTTSRHNEKILKVVNELSAKGYRCIPIHKKRPDIIALKDGKVYAVEVTHALPMHNKWDETDKKYYDDIIWIVVKHKR
jgi:hypothetical protein